MKELSLIDWVAIIIIIIGGLNWGVLGVFNVNVISQIFGDASAITKVIYILAGISAVYIGVLSMSLVRKQQ